MTRAKRYFIRAISVLLFVLIFGGIVVFIFSGENTEIVRELLSNSDLTQSEIQNLLGRLGWRGVFAISLLSMLQVILTFMPAEPVQVMGGLTYGLLDGTLICLLGVFVGSTLLYVLYKIFGTRLTRYFARNVEFDFEAAKSSPKIAFVILILYLLPAIPYGLICLFTASMGTKYPRYIVLTTLGSIPSIVIGVGLGHLAIATSWIISLSVFAVVIILLILLYKYKSKVFGLINDYVKRNNTPYSSKTEVKECSTVFYRMLCAGSKLIFDPKAKIRLINNVGKLDRPSVVLANHGSALDFVYTSRLLKKEKPHIITGRLYFYSKKLGNLLKHVGCFPKSMFASDIESVKNCLKVIAKKGVLLMMPEARLATMGQFEDIQPSTFSFLRKLNVSVYTIKIDGSYLSNPKWGNGLRRGSYIYAELNKLFSAGELRGMTEEEIKNKVEDALYYDDFEWLKTQPKVRYKSRKLAEGLENVLSICPDCGKEYTLTTKGKVITCTHCGMTTAIDNRYRFLDGRPFETPKEWFDYQVELLRQAVSSPDYRLSSNVELFHSSPDGKTRVVSVGKGVCTLSHEGLRYVGTRYGERTDKLFTLDEMYRLLFGAGEDFEIYEGSELWYFVPDEKRSCVTWYLVSCLLKEIYEKGTD